MGEHQSTSYDHDGRGAAIVRFSGDLDLAAGDELVDAVTVALVAMPRANGGEAEVQLDLSGVSFIDCAGLSALLRAQRSAGSHGCTLRVGAMAPVVHRLLGLTDTLDVLVAPGLPDPA